MFDYILAKMEGSQSSEKLLTFLNSIGFNFTNDRGMLEHCRDGRNLLKVVVDVIKHFQPAYLRSILAMECHRICEDLDRHRESLPVISDFLVVREVFRATGFEFRLADYIHGERQGKEGTPLPRTQAILSHLYALYQWNKQIQISNNAVLGKLKLLQKDNRTISEKLAEVTAELTEVERVKVMERPAYLERTKAIAELREELARIRTGKSELAALKGLKEKQLIDKTREYEECIYRIQAFEIDLANARKELSINAPQVRKEKLRQDAALQEALAKQQRLSLYLIRLRNLMDNKFAFLENNLARLNNLTQVDILDSRNNDLKNFAKRLKLEEERKRETLRRQEEEISNNQRDIINQDKREEIETQLIAQLKSRKALLRQTLESKRVEVRKLGEGVSSLAGILRNARNDLDDKDRHESDAFLATNQELKRLEREFAEWRRKVETTLALTHEPFNMGLFQTEDTFPTRHS